jgi:hypothetical protein
LKCAFGLINEGLNDLWRYGKLTSIVLVMVAACRWPKYVSELQKDSKRLPFPTFYLEKLGKLKEI